jgi:Tol biopolymer transport system component
MTIDRMERRLPDILDELSVPQVPDYLDDILRQTARTPQRPGWASLERWLPVDLTLRPTLVGRVPLRSIAVLALLMLALLVATLVYIGSQQWRPAPWYGPAANGSIVFDRDGDLYIADASLASERLVVGGQENDWAARFSLDGGTIFFARGASPGLQLMAADADGGNVRRIPAEPLRDGVAAEVSPDGSRVVTIDVVGDRTTLAITPLDGSGPARDLDTGDVQPTVFAQWRPPNGAEIVFLGHPGGDRARLGLYSIRPDGRSFREISLKTGESFPDAEDPIQWSFQGISLSDDGSTAAYWNWEPGAVANRDCSVHFIDLDSGNGRRVIYDETARCELNPFFVGDGRVVIERHNLSGGTEAQFLVGPIDGSTPGTRIGPVWDTAAGAWSTLSPDRRAILQVEEQSGRSRLIPIDGGNTTEGSVRLSGWINWQRLAP